MTRNDVQTWTPSNELRLQADGTILQRWMSTPIGLHEWRAFQPVQQSHLKYDLTVSHSNLVESHGNG